MLALRAAGFMATRTLGASPGVEISWSEMWIWKADTPASVPAGARISAGKSGRVAMSLPNTALTLEKRSPVSSMPSSESPAKRMTTRSSSCSGCSLVDVSLTRPPCSAPADVPHGIAGFDVHWVGSKSRKGGFMDWQQLLGDEAEALLDHKSETIPRDQLILPGPDFTDR